MLLSPAQRHDLGDLFRGAIVLACSPARSTASTPILVAFKPGSDWHYFPCVPEMFVTVGLVAFEIARLHRSSSRCSRFSAATSTPTARRRRHVAHHH